MKNFSKIALLTLLSFLTISKVVAETQEQMEARLLAAGGGTERMIEPQKIAAREAEKKALESKQLETSAISPKPYLQPDGAIIDKWEADSELHYAQKPPSSVVPAAKKESTASVAAPAKTGWFSNPSSIPFIGRFFTPKPAADAKKDDPKPADPIEEKVVVTPTESAKMPEDVEKATYPLGKPGGAMASALATGVKLPVAEKLTPPVAPETEKVIKPADSVKSTDSSPVKPVDEYDPDEKVSPKEIEAATAEIKATANPTMDAEQRIRDYWEAKSSSKRKEKIAAAAAISVLTGGVVGLTVVLPFVLYALAKQLDKTEAEHLKKLQVEAGQAQAHLDGLREKGMATALDELMVTKLGLHPDRLDRKSQFNKDRGKEDERTTFTKLFRLLNNDPQQFLDVVEALHKKEAADLLSDREREQLGIIRNLKPEDVSPLGFFGRIAKALAFPPRTNQILDKIKASLIKPVTQKEIDELKKSNTAAQTAAGDSKKTEEAQKIKVVPQAEDAAAIEKTKKPKTPEELAADLAEKKKALLDQGYSQEAATKILAEETEKAKQPLPLEKLKTPEELASEAAAKKQSLLDRGFSEQNIEKMLSEETKNQTKKKGTLIEEENASKQQRPPTPGLKEVKKPNTTLRPDELAEAQEETIPAKAPAVAAATDNQPKALSGPEKEVLRAGLPPTKIPPEPVEVEESKVATPTARPATAAGAQPSTVPQTDKLMTSRSTNAARPEELVETPAEAKEKAGPADAIQSINDFKAKLVQENTNPTEKTTPVPGQEKPSYAPVLGDLEKKGPSELNPGTESKMTPEGRKIYNEMSPTAQQLLSKPVDYQAQIAAEIALQAARDLEKSKAETEKVAQLKDQEAQAETKVPATGQPTEKAIVADSVPKEKPVVKPEEVAKENPTLIVKDSEDITVEKGNVKKIQNRPASPVKKAALSGLSATIVPALIDLPEDKLRALPSTLEPVVEPDKNPLTSISTPLSEVFLPLRQTKNLSNDEEAFKLIETADPSELQKDIQEKIALIESQIAQNKADQETTKVKIGEVETAEKIAMKERLVKLEGLKSDFQSRKLEVNDLILLTFTPQGYNDLTQKEKDDLGLTPKQINFINDPSKQASQKQLAFKKLDDDQQKLKAEITRLRKPYEELKALRIKIIEEPDIAKSNDLEKEYAEKQHNIPANSQLKIADAERELGNLQDKMKEQLSKTTALKELNERLKAAIEKTDAAKKQEEEAKKLVAVAPLSTETERQMARERIAAAAPAAPPMAAEGQLKKAAEMAKTEPLPTDPEQTTDPQLARRRKEKLSMVSLGLIQSSSLTDGSKFVPLTQEQITKLEAPSQGPEKVLTPNQNLSPQQIANLAKLNEMQKQLYKNRKNVQEQKAMVKKKLDTIQNKSVLSTPFYDSYPSTPTSPRPPIEVRKGPGGSWSANTTDSTQNEIDAVRAQERERMRQQSMQPQRTSSASTLSSPAVISPRVQVTGSRISVKPEHLSFINQSNGAGGGTQQPTQRQTHK